MLLKSLSDIFVNINLCRLYAIFLRSRAFTTELAFSNRLNWKPLELDSVSPLVLLKYSDKCLKVVCAYYIDLLTICKCICKHEIVKTSNNNKQNYIGWLMPVKYVNKMKENVLTGLL